MLQGTSMQDLHMQESGHGAQFGGQFEGFNQQQQQPLINQPHNLNQPVQAPQHQQLHEQIAQNREYPVNMKHLAKEMDQELSDDTDFLDKIEEEAKKKKKSKKVVEEESGLVSRVPKLLREPLIILVVYVALSQPQVRSAISKYVPQIVPGSDGKVGIAGIIVYGVIIATIFAVLKRIILGAK